MKRSFVGVFALLSFLCSSTPAYARSGGGSEFVGYLLVALFVIVVVLAVFREVICWYWKINQRIALMKEIRDALQSPTSAVSSQMSQERRESPPVSRTKCPKCGKSHIGDLRGQFCESCGEKL